jgi:hypothetical protein
MLGIKKHKPHRLLGVKHQKIDLALGNKHYAGMKSEKNHEMEMTEDGLIHNESNSNDVQREPMKHSEYKHYKKDIRHSNIEKPRRKKDDYHDKDFA